LDFLHIIHPNKNKSFGCGRGTPNGAGRSRWIFIEKINKGKKMAVAIRLSRHGAKKNPYYHIIVADSRLARDSGNILATIGKYDPMQPKGERVKLDADKAKAWLSKGARPSDRVYKFLANAGILTPRAIPVQTKKDKPSEKTLMKLKDKEAKLAKIAEATAAAEVAPKAEEAPASVEEVPAEVAVETPAVEEAAEVPVAESAPQAEEVAPQADEASAE
jgi:small subunit ribosomal protein S16